MTEVMHEGRRYRFDEATGTTRVFVIGHRTFGGWTPDRWVPVNPRTFIAKYIKAKATGAPLPYVPNIEGGCTGTLDADFDELPSY